MLCINKVLGVTPCGAVKCAFRLPPKLLALFVSCHFIHLPLFLSDPARAALGRSERLCQYSCPTR